MSAALVKVLELYHVPRHRKSSGWWLAEACAADRYRESILVKPGIRA